MANESVVMSTDLIKLNFSILRCHPGNVNNGLTNKFYLFHSSLTKVVKPVINLEN